MKVKDLKSGDLVYLWPKFKFHGDHEFTENDIHIFVNVTEEPKVGHYPFKSYMRKIYRFIDPTLKAVEVRYWRVQRSKIVGKFEDTV